MLFGKTISLTWTNKIKKTFETTYELIQIFLFVLGGCTTQILKPLIWIAS